MKDSHEDVKTVIIHIGTNNLHNSVWEKDRLHFNNLLCTLKEKYLCADIFVCHILPRWDCQLLHEQSLYYNKKINELSAKLNFKTLEWSKDFSNCDDLFAPDGLHLNSVGKSFLANEVEIGINKEYCRNSSEQPRTWIPPELKILNRGKKKKQNLLPWKETDLDLVIHIRREKYGTPIKKERSRRKCSRKKKNSLQNKNENGFHYPRKTYLPPPPVQLPPNRHIPTPLPATISYIDLESSTHLLSPTCSANLAIPAQPSPYIHRKKRGQLKWKRRQREKAKRRRKCKKVKLICLCAFGGRYPNMCEISLYLYGYLLLEVSLFTLG